ncbi:MAG TPA: hypothetical protein VMB50_20680 [Myxococcales bacterium]|nr:hypothetical protein [Myxococcales bacterium]
MTAIVVPLAVLVVVLLFFLVGRELVCWYWKINEGLQLLRQIHDRLGSVGKLMAEIEEKRIARESGQPARREG